MDSYASSSVSKPRKRQITRNRESLACIECRNRKLRCDHGQPCGSCVRRNEPGSCVYGRGSERDEASSRARILQGESRLRHLERLVEEFIQSKDAGSSRQSDETSELTPARPDDYVSMDSRMTENGRYLGSTHYSAMLDDIQELRDILYIADDNYNETTTLDTQSIDEFSILFGGTSCPTLAVVLSRYLPSREEVDRRIATYFGARAITAPFLHVPTFHRQYQEFWRDQLNTSPLWISMLFSMCQLSKSVGPGPASENPYDRDFSIAAAYCLAIGHYHRPQRFTIEACLAYLHGNINTRLDIPRDAGTLMAMVIQLCYTMGYHRDPDHFKHLTVFEGEMRRRVWAVCMQLDLLISFQLGLPNKVQPDSWDTRPLTNLLDADIREDMRALPPGRAPTEPTQAMFYNAKQQLMSGFPKVLRHALAASPRTTDAELRAVDAELRASYAAIPAALQWRRPGPDEPAAGGAALHTLHDPVSVVVTRRCLELLFQKCLCILHRRYVAAGREASIRVCRDAASLIVQGMLDLYPQVQPGGPLWADRWLAYGAFLWNDFLLGIMVLCLILRQHRRAPVPSFSQADVDEILAQLRASRDICAAKVSESRECPRTIRLLDAVLTDAASTPASGPAPSGTSVSAGDESAPAALDLGGLWGPMDVNAFDVDEWAFLEDSFDGFLR